MFIGALAEALFTRTTSLSRASATSCCTNSTNAFRSRDPAQARAFCKAVSPSGNSQCCLVYPVVRLDVSVM